MKATAAIQQRTDSLSNKWHQGRQTSTVKEQNLTSYIQINS